jgi:hypothetical protein
VCLPIDTENNIKNSVTNKRGTYLIKEVRGWRLEVGKKNNIKLQKQKKQ